MAKKIDRARIESGRFELPKKLAFLLSEKVDFESITDTDGAWSVQVPAAVLQRLLKSKTELKTIKAENKIIATGHANLLVEEKAAHEETQRALAAANRKLKSLEKKLASAVAVPAAAQAVKAVKAVAVKADSGTIIGNGAPATKVPKKASKPAAGKTKAASASKVVPAAAPAPTPASAPAVASLAQPVVSAEPAAKVVKKVAKVVAPKVKAETTSIAAPAKEVTADEATPAAAIPESIPSSESAIAN